MWDWGFSSRIEYMLSMDDALAFTLSPEKNYLCCKNYK